MFKKIKFLVCSCVVLAGCISGEPSQENITQSLETYNYGDTKYIRLSEAKKLSCKKSTEKSGYICDIRGTLLTLEWKKYTSQYLPGVMSGEKGTVTQTNEETFAVHVFYDGEKWVMTSPNG